MAMIRPHWDGNIPSFLQADVNVSTLTPLLAFTAVSRHHDRLWVTLDNTDGTNVVFLQVENSMNGTRVDVDSPPVLEIAAGKTGSICINPEDRREYVRVSAYSLTPGFPVVAIRWLMLGESSGGARRREGR